MASLSLKHIYKKYPGGVTAVSDFNLEIKDKEFLIFVGPSGCGKSTTLRMIAGLEEISEGELWIGDKYVNDVAPKDRDIAMVFQNYALYPHMTVFDNMAFGHVGVKSVVLEHHRDVSVLRRDVVNERFADEEFAFGDFFETCDHTERGRLTATRRTDEDDELFVLDFKVEVRNGGNAAGIFLVNVFQGKTCHC